MIPRSLKARPSEPWQDQLRDAYRDPLEFLDDLQLDAGAVDYDARAAQDFPFRVTRQYAARIIRGDPNDPLLKQVLPDRAELSSAVGFTRDPVGEFELGRGSALLQKYNARALLLVHSACAIHCRYCFRRAYPYSEHQGELALRDGLDRLAANEHIHEVILSGGDPLIVNDDKLAELLQQLEAIPHLRRVRLHSRLPVVLPDRVTERLIERLKRSRLNAVMVIHSNHPHELDAPTMAGLTKFRAAGIVTLNQAVLLRGINDDIETLAALSERLFCAGVMPYYLHLLDRVCGTAHFDLNDTAIRALEDGLRARVPGYLMPRFVRENPGQSSKSPFRFDSGQATALDGLQGLP